MKLASFGVYMSILIFFFFFFNDTATTEIYTLSLHDALPIWSGSRRPSVVYVPSAAEATPSTHWLLASKTVIQAPCSGTPPLATVPVIERPAVRLKSTVVSAPAATRTFAAALNACTPFENTVA